MVKIAVILAELQVTGAWWSFGGLMQERVNLVRRYALPAYQVGIKNLITNIAFHPSFTINLA